MQEIKIFDKIYRVEDHWFWKQYNQEQWEPQTLDIYKKYLNTKTTYIDIGSWLGVTLFYANELGCKSLYGVEANPLSFELLKKNCENNNLKVQLDNLCIYDKNELVSFGSTNSNETSSNSSISGNQFQVQGITLRDYLKDKPKDNLFVKIDIEGAEELIIDDLLNVHGIIYLSIHVPFISNKKVFLDKLQRFGTNCNNLEEKILTNEVFPKWGTTFGNFFEICIFN